MANPNLYTSFDVYSRKYQRVRMTRRNGILELCLHSEGGSLKWDLIVHEELGYCFGDVANARTTRL